MAEPDAGMPSDSDVPDAQDTGTATCTTDRECSDDVFCNGPERCTNGPMADAFGCEPSAGPPCLAVQTCSESEGRCMTDCDVTGDADSDGEDSVDCGGTDCDDADPRRYPGNVEICDPEMHDEDCDSTTFGFRDQDMDGFPDAQCCNVNADDTLSCGSDCDDLVAIVHPTEAESCDGLDNDCDSFTDEGVTGTFYPDMDGDDFGDAEGTPIEGCAPPGGYVGNNTDCDDTSSARNPGAPEVCDLVPDNDCDPSTNPFDADLDGHDRADCGGDDCQDGDATIYTGATESCNRIDNDCSDDGLEDLGEDLDGDGHSDATFCVAGRFPADDCDETRGYVHGGAPEHCNGIDDDCDPSTPEPAAALCTAAPRTSFAIATNVVDGLLRRASVAADAGGGAVIAGTFEGTVDFGSGPIEATPNVSFDHNDVFVASYRPDGSLRWVQTFGNDQSEWMRSIGIAADGTIVVVGQFDGTVTFGTTTFTAPSPDDDLFILWLDPATGALRRAAQVGSPDFLSLREGEMTVLPDGSVVLPISSAGTVTFSGGGALTPGAREVDYLVRITPMGALDWSWSPYPTGDYRMRHVAVDYDPGTDRLYAAFAVGFSLETRLRAIDATTGAGVWAEDTLFPSADLIGPYPTSLVVGPSGAVFVLSYFDRVTTIGNARWEALHTWPSDTLLLARFEADGSVGWSNVFGDFDSVDTADIAVSGTDLVVATRSTWRSSDDLFGNTMPSGGDVPTFMQLTTDGGFRWAERATPLGVSETRPGNIDTSATHAIAAGWFWRGATSPGDALGFWSRWAL